MKKGVFPVSTFLAFSESGLAETRPQSPVTWVENLTHPLTSPQFTGRGGFPSLTRFVRRTLVGRSGNRQQRARVHSNVYSNRDKLKFVGHQEVGMLNPMR
jgi:hypothetical protein